MIDTRYTTQTRKVELATTIDVSAARRPRRCNPRRVLVQVQYPSGESRLVDHTVFRDPVRLPDYDTGWHARCRFAIRSLAGAASIAIANRLPSISYSDMVKPVRRSVA